MKVRNRGLPAGTEGCFEGKREIQSLSGKGEGRDRAAPEVRVGR